MVERFNENDDFMREAMSRAFGNRSGNQESDSEKLSPSQRTEMLFSQDVTDLSATFRRRIIGLAGSPKRIRVESAIPYSKTPREGEWEIGKNYIRGKEGKTIENLPYGMLWAFPLPHRKLKEGGNVRQALVTAKDHDERSGACVQVTRVSKYNPVTREFDPMEREADFAVYFELDNNETTELRFLDDSEVLFVVRGQNEALTDAPDAPTDFTSEKANVYLRGLIKDIE